MWTSADGLVWSRVPHDETVFGGPGDQEMMAVVAGGPGLVAVGRRLGGDCDAAVWTSADGLAWSRVPHDETVFGGPGDQGMMRWWRGVRVWSPSATTFGGDADAAVWTSADGLVWSRVPHDEAVFGGPGDQGMWGGGGGSGSGRRRLGRLGWRIGCGGVDFGGWAGVVPGTPRRGRVRRPRQPEMMGVVAGGPGLVAVGGTEGIAAVWVSPPPG